MTDSFNSVMTRFVEGVENSTVSHGRVLRTRIKIMSSGAELGALRASTQLTSGRTLPGGDGPTETSLGFGQGDGAALAGPLPAGPSAPSPAAALREPGAPRSRTAFSIDTLYGKSARHTGQTASLQKVAPFSPRKKSSVCLVSTPPEITSFPQIRLP